MARGGYRPNSGPKKGTKYRPRASKGATPKKTKKSKIPQDIVDEAKAVNLTPLAYMLKVMNDDKETDKARRDRMAIAAAPFVHARKGEGAGKKEEKADKAASAGKGKFSTGRAPLAVVK
jgi:hypothetical protein